MTHATGPNANAVIVFDDSGAVAAIHQAGLVSLTHTPSPMGFLNKLLHRPAHQKPFLLLVVGHPAEGAKVPDIQRKALSEISSFV